MALFGRRRRTPAEPERSPEWLAREAEIERRIAAEPPMVWAPDAATSPYAERILETLRTGGLAALDAQYASLDGLERSMWANDAVDAVLGLDQRRLLQASEQHGSAVSLMLATGLAVGIGFEERGEGLGGDLSGGQRSGFESWLEHARALGERAHEAAGGDDPHPLITAQAATVTLGAEAAIAHSQRWQAIDPWNPMGWLRFMAQMDARWLGNADSLPQMAVHLAERAPEGHPVVPLSCRILGQHWHTLFTFGEMRDADADALVWRGELGRRVTGAAWERFAQARGAGRGEASSWDWSAWDWLLYGVQAVPVHSWAAAVFHHQQGRIATGAWEQRFSDPLAAATTRRARAIRVVTMHERPLPEDADADIDWGAEGPPSPGAHSAG